MDGRVRGGVTCNFAIQQTTTSPSRCIGVEFGFVSASAVVDCQDGALCDWCCIISLLVLSSSKEDGWKVRSAQCFLRSDWAHYRILQVSQHNGEAVP